MTDVLGLPLELAQKLLEAEGVRVALIPYAPRKKVLEPDETRVVRVRASHDLGITTAHLTVCECKTQVQAAEIRTDEPISGEYI